MAEFKKVAKELDRMCERHVICNDCPISSKNNGRGITCHLFVHQFPEEAECIIMEWAEKNPIMTNGKKFQEVFGISGKSIVAIGMLDWLKEEYKGGLR